ncbi:glutathione peroxidase [uncultured Algibacter sp.]|uniref:glutathione peroxidase n=1 Tax=uncultured Algibacter sp. TaxID=298659 RepID=UPI0026336B6F|nr:glutathione peroxidase [uncultured Algibacter sp.]
MNILKTFVATLGSNSVKKKMNINSIYEIKINTLYGQPIDLSKFKGKHLLFVNVASKCGFTPQYKKLQDLHEQYEDKLQVIGVPCNQFGNQEPGDAESITEFCKINYGVSFLITEKIKVKGNQMHPLYLWLTQKVNNGISNSSVKWNFQKYLVDKDGILVDYFFSATNPLSSKITKHLK